MSTNYFENLILRARELDDGITMLTETWKIPHVLVGRFAECTDETSASTQSVWDTIKSTQNGIEEIRAEIRSSSNENSVGIDQLLQETKEAYKELKEQCDNLDTVLAEYGYRYEENDSVDEATSTQSVEPNLHTSPQKSNLAVEFTPDLSWKYKVRSSDPSLMNSTCDSHAICTPKSTQGLKIQSSIKHKDYTICTPIRERPQEPIYSKHFYNVLRK